MNPTDFNDPKKAREAYNMLRAEHAAALHAAHGLVRELANATNQNDALASRISDLEQELGGKPSDKSGNAAKE